MVENFKLVKLTCQSGIKQDCTSTEGNYWGAGLWTRFYRGLPRSMGGYRSMSENYAGTSRGLFVNPTGTGYIDIFNGTSNVLEVAQFNLSGFGSSPVNITPVGFAASADNLWQFDTFYNSNGGGSISIIAHAAPNLTIDSNIDATVWYGDATATAALTKVVKKGTTDAFQVSGGVLSLQPYLIAFGSKGVVYWSELNDPTKFDVNVNAANICSTKIVQGMAVRGGSSSPSALLWSLDSLIQMSFVGGAAVWSFNTISDQSSILSSNGVVEMDGVYYWLGLDRFLTFNGVLRELPNILNLDYLFTNLNFSQRQKVFGFKVPRWGEIWWCVPLGDATECNHAFIYNVRENTWYDTPLPKDGRSAAFFAQNFPYPIMSSAKGLTPIGSVSGTNYLLWQHEYGFDEVRQSNIDAIKSSVTSCDFSILAGTDNSLQSSMSTQLVQIEPDFLGLKQTIEIYGKQFAMDDYVLLDTRDVEKKEVGNYYTVRSQARYLRYTIISNSQGSSYQLGKMLIGFRGGDARP